MHERRSAQVTLGVVIVFVVLCIVCISFFFFFTSSVIFFFSVSLNDNAIRRLWERTCSWTTPWRMVTEVAIAPNCKALELHSIQNTMAGYMDSKHISVTPFPPLFWVI